jgi:CRP-like cAMP-binding protein
VTPDQHRRNRLLAALPPRDFALLEPHLQIVPIAEGEFLHLPGDAIDRVYFLHSGIVSLMAVSEDGDAIATASVGSEGAIGTIAGTGFVHAFTRALVQAPGVASRIAASPFRRAVSKSEAISDLLTRYHMALMCQVQQTSLCNAVHDAISRLSRLLLVLSEQSEEDSISFSQERLATPKRSVFHPTYCPGPLRASLAPAPTHVGRKECLQCVTTVWTSSHPDPPRSETSW